MVPDEPGSDGTGNEISAIEPREFADGCTAVRLHLVSMDLCRPKCGRLFPELGIASQSKMNASHGAAGLENRRPQGIVPNECHNGAERVGEEATIMTWQEFIEERADIMAGKPVFKGTRITVEHALAELGRGMPEKELLRGHSRLTPQHIRAAMLYAAAIIGTQEVIT